MDYYFTILYRNYAYNVNVNLLRIFYGDKPKLFDKRSESVTTLRDGWTDGQFLTDQNLKILLIEFEFWLVPNNFSYVVFRWRAILFSRWIFLRDTKLCVIQRIWLSRVISFNIISTIVFTSGKSLYIYICLYIYISLS